MKKMIFGMRLLPLKNLYKARLLLPNKCPEKRKFLLLKMLMLVKLKKLGKERCKRLMANRNM